MCVKSIIYLLFNEGQDLKTTINERKSPEYTTKAVDEFFPRSYHLLELIMSSIAHTHTHSRLGYVS